jgi:type I restriction enzyme S subunit
METLQPKLRFPEFEGDWEEKNIGDVTNVTAGGTPSTLISDYWNGSIRWMNSGDLNLKRVFEVKNRITELGLKKSSTKFIPKFSILIGLAGQGKTRGTVAMNMVKLCINQSIGAIYPNNDFFNSDFLYHNLDNRYDELRSLSTGDGGRGGLNLSIIKDLVVNFPSLEEQTKIANFISSVDEKINFLKEKKELLEDYKKGIMQKIFNQEIRFKDDNGNDFEKWQEKSLGEIGTFQTSSIDKLSRDEEEEVFLVNYMNVYRHENINNYTKVHLQIVTAKDSQINSCNLKKGDILFTPSSETPDDIGHSVVIFEDLDNCVYSYHLMRFRPNIEIDILYSHYFCNNTKVLGQISRLATGSTRFTISVKSFSSIIIDLPCLKEQTKIANFLSAIDEKIELVSNQIQDTLEYKKGLLQQMFV